MIEMSPFYAHESTVGPVFDVATWSRAKAWTMAVGAFVFGLLVVAPLILAWKPTLVVEKPPKFVAEFHQATLKLQKEHPWGAYAGTGIVAFLGWLALMGSCAGVVAALKGDYFARLHRDRPAGSESASSGAAAAAENGFQVNVADVEEGVKLTLELFDEVYRLPRDFPLVVERI